MRWVYRAAGLVVGIIMAKGVAANIVELPYSQKVQESQIVIVGQVVSNLPPDRRLPGAVSIVKVTHILKGRPSRRVRIYRTLDHIAEFNLDCCRVGATYMMFMRRKGRYPYMAVNGRHGIVEVGR